MPASRFNTEIGQFIYNGNGETREPPLLVPWRCLGASLAATPMPTFDPQSIVLATLAGSLLLFLTDAIRYDAVAILVVLVLAGSGVLTTEDAFSNFAHESVILVAAMYAFSAAVSRHGITEGLCQKLLGGQGVKESWLAFKLVLVTGLLSSVLSNSAVVATMIPVLGNLSKRSGVQASRLLMPMAFGSLLGGMLTLVGTSKNIAVNGVIRELGGEPFGLFDFTGFGLLLLLAGALYFLGPGRRLLPKRGSARDLSEHYQVPKFLTEVLVHPGSEWVDRSVQELDALKRFDVSLLGLIRHDGEKLFAPGPYLRLKADDAMILQGEPNAILRMRRELCLEAQSEVQQGDVKLISDDVQLVEAVVPPTSNLIGRLLGESDFQGSTNLNVLGVSKYGARDPRRISETKLDVGDTLLLQGHTPDLERLTRSRQLIVLGEHQLPELGSKAWLTVALLFLVLALGAFTEIHVAVAALGGALALVLFKCVRSDEVGRSIDLSVLVLIGGMLSLGSAFTKVGLDQRIAEWITGLGSGLAQSPHLVVGLIFVTAMLLTQMVNHITAGVLMAPVAMTMAERLGMSDRPLLMAVLAGAEFAFISPVAHQANAMIMGPGDYRYRDFVRCGTPLSILLVIVGVILIPLFWPLYPTP